MMTGKDKHIVNCKWCDNTFEVHDCKIKDGRGKFCSRICYHAHQGRNKVKATCHTCGSDFKMEPARGMDRIGGSKSGNVFCSRECWYEYNRGSNVYNFNDDRILYEQIRSCYKMTEWKKDVLKRDEYKCQHCGEIENLEVHHIKLMSDLMREYDIQSLDDAIACDDLWDINNGTILCVGCHAKEHPNIGMIQHRAKLLEVI